MQGPYHVYSLPPLPRSLRFALRVAGWVLAALLVLSLVLVLVSDLMVENQRQYTYDDVAQIPYNKVAVILGTSRFLADGSRNEYFWHRIESAAALYQQGKASFFLVSGDNAHVSYNEPREMRRALVKAGIPAERIYSDYAGFRTLDSVVRAREVFGQESYTVVSQQFHNERAIFLARHFGIRAIGLNAGDETSYSNVRTWLRERLARVLCLFDVYLLNKQPRFLGKPEQIG